MSGQSVCPECGSGNLTTKRYLYNRKTSRPVKPMATMGAGGLIAAFGLLSAFLYLSEGTYAETLVSLVFAAIGVLLIVVYQRTDKVRRIRFTCRDCGHVWRHWDDTGWEPVPCPNCGANTTTITKVALRKDTGESVKRTALYGGLAGLGASAILGWLGIAIWIDPPPGTDSSPLYWLALAAIVLFPSIRSVLSYVSADRAQRYYCADCENAWDLEDA